MAGQDQAARSVQAGENLIAGAYSVDFGTSLSHAAGGLQAYAAHQVRGNNRNLMAVEVPSGLPPRPAAFTIFPSPLPNVVVPLAHGAARGPDRRMRQFVVGFAPPGLPLCESARPVQGAFTPWTEFDLLKNVLAPAAAVLEEMRTRHFTHRAIRPNNVFRSPQGGPITLGAFWASAPAGLQSSICEPPYVAMCHPAGRGSGSCADDVYALGVLLLVLAAGHAPLPDLSDEEIVARKIELGSFAALTADIRLPSSLGDLIRGMLAEEPDHRPTPSLLVDPAAARARRLAARPRRKAAKPIEIGSRLAWDGRSAAYGLVRTPELAASIVRTGALGLWLRRVLGDGQLAGRIDEQVRLIPSGPDPGVDGDLVMRTVCMLDPLAPLCWRGLAFWPDGIGALLSPHSDSEVLSRLHEVLSDEIAVTWAMFRPDRCNIASIKLDARQHRTMLRATGWTGGLQRLRYTLNTMIPIASPLLANHIVTRMPDLLPALEAPKSGAAATAGPLDREICAFLAARNDHRADADIVTLTQAKAAADAIRANLYIFADLQVRFSEAERFPKLCGRLAQHAALLVESWRNRPRRRHIDEKMSEIVQRGSIPALLALLDDPAARVRDEEDGNRADDEIVRIDQELDQLDGATNADGKLAQRVGAEVAAAASAAALFATVIALALG